MKIRNVDLKYLNKVIINYKPTGRFYSKDDNKYIAVDNTTGDAWTEEFDTESECLLFLKGYEDNGVRQLVINKQYGYFELSKNAQERLIELGIKYYKSVEELMAEGEYVYNRPYILSGKEFGIENKYYDNFSNIRFRENPLLIRMVKELGDKASTKNSSLKIVNIKEDIKLTIEKSNGKEFVYEKRLVW